MVLDEDGLKTLCSDSPIARRLVAEGVKSFCSVPLLAHDRSPVQRGAAAVRATLGEASFGHEWARGRAELRQVSGIAH